MENKSARAKVQAFGGFLTAMVMRIEAADGFDGLEHLPGGDQLLMIGEHVRACGHQTVAVARQGTLS